MAVSNARTAVGVKRPLSRPTGGRQLPRSPCETSLGVINGTAAVPADPGVSRGHTGQKLWSVEPNEPSELQQKCWRTHGAGVWGSKWSFQELRLLLVCCLSHCCSAGQARADVLQWSRSSFFPSGSNTSNCVRALTMRKGADKWEIYSDSCAHSDASGCMCGRKCEVDFPWNSARVTVVPMAWATSAMSWIADGWNIGWTIVLRVLGSKIVIYFAVHKIK